MKCFSSTPTSDFSFLVGPQLACPTKLQVREGERLSCEVRGNPQPLVNWYKDGKTVELPTHSRRQHAGKYTVCAGGVLGQKNFTVEVEVLPSSGRLTLYNNCIFSLNFKQKV